MQPSRNRKLTPQLVQLDSGENPFRFVRCPMPARDASLICGFLPHHLPAELLKSNQSFSFFSTVYDANLSQHERFVGVVLTIQVVAASGASARTTGSRAQLADRRASTSTGP